MYITIDITVQAIHTLMRELKISYTLEILTSVFTHWYWSMITVTSDSRIRPIATRLYAAHLYLF